MSEKLFSDQYVEWADIHLGLSCGCVRARSPMCLLQVRCVTSASAMAECWTAAVRSSLLTGTRASFWRTLTCSGSLRWPFRVSTTSSSLFLRQTVLMDHRGIGDPWICIFVGRQFSWSNMKVHKHASVSPTSQSVSTQFKSMRTHEHAPVCAVWVYGLCVCVAQEMLALSYSVSPRGWRGISAQKSGHKAWSRETSPRRRQTGNGLNLTLNRLYVQFYMIYFSFYAYDGSLETKFMKRNDNLNGYFLQSFCFILKFNLFFRLFIMLET